MGMKVPHPYFFVMTKDECVCYLRVRVANGDTLVKIARDFGVHRNTMLYWVHGQLNPSATARRVAELLIERDRSAGLGAWNMLDTDLSI